jgi:hypothetical protein
MMQLTPAQWTFLADLRRGPRAAIACLDASMIGPLIRAELVAWTDDADHSSHHHAEPNASFALTLLGASHMGARDLDAYQVG